MRYKILAFLTLIYMFTWGCVGEEFNEPKVSRTGSTESHFWGTNCMDCHKKGGPGEGWFTIAGSVLDLSTNQPATSGYIELWEEPGKGSPVAVIEIDELGNFYTTQDIGIRRFYPAAVNTKGERVFMPFATSIGACNSCHSQTFAPPIWIP